MSSTSIAGRLSSYLTSSAPMQGFVPVFLRWVVEIVWEDWGGQKGKRDRGGER